MNTSSSNLPTQDERVMAALAHLTAILPLLGILAPIVIWVTQRQKSPYVAFQALQAIAHQVIMILVWFLGMGCYMCSFFGMFFSIPFIESSSRPSATPEMPFFGIPFFAPFAAMGLMLFSEFILVIYGLIGSVLTIQGKNFRYWLIGQRVERFMQQS